MTLVPKNYWSLTKPRYERGLLSGVYNNTWSNTLYLKSIAPTYENLEPLMDRLSERWGWNKQDRYNEEDLRDKLSQDGTVLYLLCDASENDAQVGYALVSEVSQDLKDRFWPAANDTKVIEIDNLGLFPGNEGGGRGKAYFEMLFKEHFKNHDVVYWSQHETHSPTLTRFYRDKMQMELMATDYVPSFMKNKSAVA